MIFSAMPPTMSATGNRKTGLLHGRVSGLTGVIQAVWRLEPARGRSYSVVRSVTEKEVTGPRRRPAPSWPLARPGAGRVPAATAPRPGRPARPAHRGAERPLAGTRSAVPRREPRADLEQRLPPTLHHLVQRSAAGSDQTARGTAPPPIRQRAEQRRLRLHPATIGKSPLAYQGCSLSRRRARTPSKRRCRRALPHPARPIARGPWLAAGRAQKPEADASVPGCR